MEKRKAGELYDTGPLIERQMLLYKARQAAAREAPAKKRSTSYRFITISRDLGALGDVIASELGTHLQWQVFDKEIVDHIAKNSHVRQDLVRQLDERAQNLIHDTVDRLLRMVEGGSFGNEEYHVALLKTLATLATQGDVILVGHGGAFALRQERGLHLRITASAPVRAERLRKRWMIPVDEARKRMQQVDAERRQFIQYHFKKDRGDSGFFDLVINTDQLSVPQAVEAVLAVLRQACSGGGPARGIP